MPKYRVNRDFGVDIAGKHFAHGETFGSETVVDDLASIEHDATDEQRAAHEQKKAAQVGLKAQAENDIAHALDDKSKPHWIHEIEPAFLAGKE